MEHDTESYSPKSDVNDIQDDMKNACSVRDVLTILLSTTRKVQNMHISLPVTSIISEPAEMAKLIPNTHLIEIYQYEHAVVLEQPMVVNRKMVNVLANPAVV
jgi:hypothetical protein